MKTPQKISVNLEVVSDKDTGLTLNKFTWQENGESKMQVEIANRPAQYLGQNQYGSPSYRVMAYDEAIDRPMAETKRAVLETMLNEGGINYGKHQTNAS